MKNRILTLRGDQATRALSLFKGIITDEGRLPMEQMDQDTLSAIAKEVFETEVDPATLPASFDGCEAIADNELQEEILHMAAVFPFLEDGMQQERVEAIHRLGERWQVKDNLIGDLIQLSRGHRMHIMLHAAREAQFEAGSPLWKQMLTQLKGVMHLDGDKDLLAEYRSYESLPEGTLGRTMTEYYNQNEFPYPGNSGAPLSNLLIQHDFHHVLSGYDTTGLGEFCVAGFAYGLTGESSYSSVLVVFMYQFHLGHKMDPAANTYRNQYTPGPVFHAFKRGSQSTADYMGKEYDFRPLMDKQLSDVRAHFNISADGMLVQNPSGPWCGSEGPPGKRGSN